MENKEAVLQVASRLQALNDWLGELLEHQNIDDPATKVLLKIEMKDAAAYLLRTASTLDET